MAFYCCTCATQLPAIFPATPAEASSSTSLQPRQLPCCDRFICGHCLTRNVRFATYCPYCQIATAPPPLSASSKTAPSKDLLPQGLKPPPPYRLGSSASAAAAQDALGDAPPPPYSVHPTTVRQLETGPETAAEATEYPSEKSATPTIHYLDHDRDSVASLSLRYRVPADLLRRANRLTADHLLQARQVVHIPALAAGPSIAVSLSPRPVEGEDAARRKAAIRRFMVACKVADYDLAVLYLEQTAQAAGGRDDIDDDDGCVFDLEAAVAAYQADELWERTHPVEKGAGAKQRAERRKRHGTGGGGGGFFTRRLPPSSSSSARPAS